MHSHSIFIDNLHSNINVGHLQSESASFGNVVDAYIPNRVTKSVACSMGLLELATNKRVKRQFYQLIGRLFGVTW